MSVHASPRDLDGVAERLAGGDAFPAAGERGAAVPAPSYFTSADVRASRYGAGSAEIASVALPRARRAVSPLKTSALALPDRRALDARTHLVPVRQPVRVHADGVVRLRDVDARRGPARARQDVELQQAARTGAAEREELDALSGTDAQAVMLHVRLPQREFVRRGSVATASLEPHVQVRSFRGERRVISNFASRRTTSKSVAPSTVAS
jgi:hypothetical protein